MARQIKSSDIFEGDIFENVRQSASKTIDMLDKMNNELKVTAQTMKKELGGLKLDSLSSIKQLIKLTEQANKISKESATINKARTDAMSAKTKAELEALAIEKQKQQVAQESIKTEREQLRLTKDLEKAEKAKLKEEERAAKVARDEANAYKQLERNTRNLKNESKRLGAELLLLEQAGRKNTKEWYALQNQYNQTTRAAQQGDAQLKKLDKTVGDNFRNVGNYASAVNKLSGFLGQLGIAFGFGAAVRYTFNTIKEFDQGIANLASVLGKSRSEIQALEKDARRLGETTKFTAGEVAQMQTEFAKLGFNETEILNATESTLALAGATGTELGRAAEVAGATLRGFGLNSREMKRVNDVMAKSFSTSALDMEKFAESMKYVAPVAKSAGVTLEETTAMLGKLADSGIRGSQAGTSLRRILTDMAATGKPAQQALAELSEKGITLSDAMDEVGRNAQTSLLVLTKNKDGIDKLTSTLDLAAEKFTKNDFFKEAKKSGMTFDKALSEINKSEDKSAKATEIFGNSMGQLALQMAETGKTSKDLQAELDKASDASQKMAETQLNTLGGSMALLKSAIEAQILGFDSASKSSERFRTVIKFLAANMGTIVTLIGKVIMYYGLYRAMLIAVAAKQYLFNGGLLQSVKNMGEVFKSTKQVTEGTKQMATGMQAAGRSMTAIPWMAVIALAYELGKALYEAASGAEELRKQKELNAQYDAQAEKLANSRAQGRARDVEKQVAEEQRLANQRLAAAKTEKERIKIQEEFLEFKNELIKSTRDEVIEDVKLNREKRKQYSEDLEFAKDYKKQLEQIRKERDEAATDEFGRRIGPVSSRTDISREEAKRLEEIAKSLKLQSTDVNDIIRILNANLVATGKKIKIYNDEWLSLNETLKDNTSDLIVNDIEQDKNNDSKKEGTKTLKEYKTELKDINEYLTEQNELLASIDRLETEKTIQAKQDEIDALLANDIKYATESGNVQVDALERLIEEKFQLEKNAILNEQKEKLKLIEQGYTEQSRKEREELIKNRDELLKQEGISAKDKEKIQKDYENQLEQIRMNDLQRNADYKLKEKELKLQTDKEIVNLDKQKAEQIESVNDQLFEAQSSYYEKLNEKSREALEKELEDQKKAAEIRKELFQLGTEYFIKKSEERIKQIEKEIAAAENQYETLKQLAIQGNIDAKESLAEQQRIIAEANKRKEKEERRKQRLQLLNTAFQTYNSKLEQDSKNPLTETIRDIGLLRAFIETIPAFEKGTEDTGVNGKGVDGKGGFHAILHPNERVIPKSMNQKIGSMSNEQLTKLAQEYQNGRIIKPNEQIGSALDTAVLINKLDELTQTIKLKPETNIELGEITQSMMEVVKSTKKGNTTTYNRYKIRK